VVTGVTFVLFSVLARLTVLMPFVCSFSFFFSGRLPQMPCQKNCHWKRMGWKFYSLVIVVVHGNSTLGSTTKLPGIGNKNKI
jgi:hypothetical protein